MKKCTIFYGSGSNSITLTFLTYEELQAMKQAMKQAIENCIEKPLEYPMINYSDKKDDVIFTAEFLKASLIKFDKQV